MSVITITSENFETEVKSSEKPVLLDFWAPWCGPCRMVSPIVDEIAEQTDAVKIGKVNVDDEAELSVAFEIVSIPTLVYMKGGEVVSKSIGAISKEEILKLIEL